MHERYLELIISGVFFVLLILLGWFIPQALITSVVVLFILLFESAIFRHYLFPQQSKILGSIFTAITILGIHTLLQTAWYYLGHSINYQSDAISLALTIGVLQTVLIVIPAHAGIQQKSEVLDSSFRWNDRKKILYLILTILPALAAFGFVISSALHAQTTNSIRTPWPLMAPGTLFAIAILFLSTFLAAWKSRSAHLTTFLSSLTLLSITLIAPLVYKLGFGFDGFLHRASEQILFNTGTLTPHPPYYIGQYVLVTFLARLFHASLKYFDIFLVPVMVAILPWIFRSSFDKKNKLLIAGLTLFLPLSSFIATTPQSFAYILGLIAICLGIRQTAFLPACILALWSIAVHPLAGLPFLGTIILLYWLHKKNHQRFFRSPITWLLLIGTLLIVPLAFFWNGLHSRAHIEWNFQSLTHLTTYSDLFHVLIPPTTRIALWPDWATLVLFLFPLVLFALSAYGCWHKKNDRSLWLLFILGIGMTVVGVFFKVSGQFTFLIDYERGNYADRLFVIAGLFLLFPALTGFSAFVQHQCKKSFTLIAAFLLFLCGWQAAQAYLALPRHDATIVGHGWSVGQADKETVKWIERDAGGTAYTVLANQSVSAAAVEMFGFKRYVKTGDDEEIFYYPIPTGGSLYEIFLRAAGNEPTRETVKEAASLSQSLLVYVVINNYWWNADQVTESLSAVADRSFDIQNKKNKIYVFDFTKETKR